MMITESLSEKKVKKGEILLHKGENSRFGYFVKSGCLKSYVYDSSGKIHILQFAPEQWFISDMNSILNGVPAVQYIDAVEDSTIHLIRKEDYEKKADFEALGKQKIVLTQNIIALNKRLTLLLSATAEERYIDFLQTYPSLVLRLPLRLIASYLGITPEYLSKIRRKLVP